LARKDPDDKLPMDIRTADAILNMDSGVSGELIGIAGKL
jgi:hypothetical protein